MVHLRRRGEVLVYPISLGSLRLLLTVIRRAKGHKHPQRVIQHGQTRRIRYLQNRLNLCSP